MRYFGRRISQSGDIPAHFNGTLETELKRRHEGERVKYRMNGNSAKLYAKAYSEMGSVLRGAQTTSNNVEDFRTYRPRKAARKRISSRGPYARCIGGPKYRRRPMTGS